MKVPLNQNSAISYAHELTKLAIENGLINQYGDEVETANAIADFFNQLVIRFTSSDSN